MILVDTSVWISHLREGNDQLVELLNNENVICHPLIIGEIACGNLKNRDKILYSLKSLPKSFSANHEEILVFIETHQLMGKGLSYIDICLLASAMLSDIQLWTFDKKLNEAAKKLVCNY